MKMETDFKKGDKVKTLSPHIVPPIEGEVRRVCKKTVYVRWDNGWYGSWPKNSVTKMEA